MSRIIIITVVRDQGLGRADGEREREREGGTSTLASVVSVHSVRTGATVLN